MKSHWIKSWTNVSGLHTAKPKKYYQPESMEDVASAIREAERLGIGIRAHGAGHTSTDAAITDGILLDMRRMNQVQAVSPTRLRPFAKGLHLAAVEAGTTLHRLNRELDDMDLAMRSLGIIDDQTISGAIATGTHGNVPTLPGFPGLVRSLVLVAAKGQAYRIEPKEGITDPRQRNEPGVTLIQDDETFRAALVHMGAFGIVVSYVLEVEPQYWLMETRTIETFAQIRQRVEAGTLHGEVEVTVEKKRQKMAPLGLHFAMNPYLVEGEHRCMVGRFFKLEKKPTRSFLEATRSLGPNLVASTMIPYATLINQANDHPDKLPKTIHSALNLMRDRSYINKSYLVWFQGLEWLADMTFGTEFAYDASNAGWLKAVDGIVKGFKEAADKTKLYSPSTLMIRQSAASPALLAADSGRPTAWIGIPAQKEHRRGQEVLDLFQDINMAHGGRCHWGKRNTRLEAHLDKLELWYPGLPKWKAQMKKFNPDGTFSNAFLKRFGLA